MTVPAVAPPPPDPSPGVRLDVRLGTGRAVGYAFAGDEFLIGGAVGCELRLAGANLPPVACQFLRSEGGLRVRRLTPTLPVFLNGEPLPPSDPSPVGDGDRVTVGPAELTVRVTADAFFTPRLVPLDDAPADDDVLERRLDVLRVELERLEPHRPPSDPDAALARRELELEAAYRVRLDELEADYAGRHARLAEELAAVRSEADDRARRVEEEIARRRLSVESDPAELGRLQLFREDLDDRESALRADREQFKDDLARLDRWQAALEDRQRQTDRRAGEVDARVEQLKRDTLELEEQVRLADGEQTRLADETDRLDRFKALLEQRENALTERAAVLEGQQAALAVLRAKLDRQDEDARREASDLIADRAALDATRADLSGRLQQASRLRDELGTGRADQEVQSRALAERNAVLAAALDDIHRQKAAADAEAERLKQKELELDARSADTAEQSAILKARVMQVLDLQERLEADRQAIRDRESGVIDAEAARQALQEQLRKRSEELSARLAECDRRTQELAAERAEVDRVRSETTDKLRYSEDESATLRRQLEDRAAALAEREAALQRQVARVREVGQAVAAERKALADGRQSWQAERSDDEVRRERVSAEWAELLRQSPELESGATVALDKLVVARDVLRGHLDELHAFARQTRQELDAARDAARGEADQLRQREQELERARADHRLAVAGFRQQLLDWQSKVAELRQSVARSESTIDRRQADLVAAAKQADVTTQELARRAAELDDERRAVAEKRSVMERHLADMREWYRRKLRELAGGKAVDDSDMPALAIPAARIDPPADLEPGDRQLGELLRGRGLVDADTLAHLWHDAVRQRRTLRQVLLASGAVTLYQLALIEGGNLDALSLGRFHVIDRLRVTPREAVYRVFDPNRPGGPSRGVYLLRHLGESEMADAVRPDEFRQRFAGSVAATHPNLVNTVEVTDILGRPAALQEWTAGLGSNDWSAAAAVPGVWVKLLADAARGLNHAHRSGLVHGRLTAESVLLTNDGVVKVAGVGEPPWLTGANTVFDPLPSADLRSLGPVAFGWAQQAKRRGTRAKPFPPPLATVVRRLESGAEPPMADVVSFDRPYSDAGELLRDLARLADEFPLPPDGWEKLAGHVADAVREDHRAA